MCDHFSLSSCVFVSSFWWSKNWKLNQKILLTIILLITLNRVSWLLCCTLDSNQDITSSNVQLVTPPTQLSGRPSQTSTVPKLLSSYSDGVELKSTKSTQLLPVWVLGLRIDPLHLLARGSEKEETLRRPTEAPKETRKCECCTKGRRRTGKLRCPQWRIVHWDCCWYWR